MAKESLSQSFMTKSGHVEFDSSVPLHSFTGVSDQLVGKISLADSTVDFYVDMHTIKTGISKRDEDMLETLEAEEYPFAEFFGKVTSPFDPNRSDPQKVTIEGKFSVHGVTNPLSIEGTLQKNGKELEATASWTLDMSDYKIKPPGILFYRVSEEVDISITASLPARDQIDDD
ncbi:YceI family protein [Aliifodinibius sp. 1BSP15-2V2]|uniref:YceI family protein n=2 Tax=Fodinibius salsisoli TaxID=2820877 RepID=A0ABT3PK65_9BACT|nr:YceI family protein [Fodinibius salsisoli]